MSLYGIVGGNTQPQCAGTGLTDEGVTQQILPRDRQTKASHV